MPLYITRNDITKMNVDAIVNAANTGLQAGGGVCGAIFNAAGAHELQAACDKLAPISTGEAVITPGFNLSAKYVIHTAGPIWRGGKHGEEEHLRSAYINSLALAVENGCESIAFPSISSGIYGYPKEEALKVATTAIREFLADHDINVTLVIFDNESFTSGKKLLKKVKSYIDKHYVDEIKEMKLYFSEERRPEVKHSSLDEKESERENEIEKIKFYFKEEQRLKTEEEKRRLERKHSFFSSREFARQRERDIDFYEMPRSVDVQHRKEPPSFEDLLGNLDESFSNTLLRLIDAKGKTDVEVYKRANLDRKLFSKIRIGKDYTPRKNTVIALAVALELSLKETEDLLKRAGFALSRSRKFDVIVEYFISNKLYDIFEINNVLFEYDQRLLGGEYC